MGTRDYTLHLRNPKTHEVIGWADHSLYEILVPDFGFVTNFVYEHNAIKDQKMGLAVEVYDTSTQKLRFAIIYSFVDQGVSCPRMVLTQGVRKYHVFSADLTNLEMLTLIHQNNELKRNVE